GHRHARACAPILSVGSGAHSHDPTGDRTGGCDLGAGPYRMSWADTNPMAFVAAEVGRPSPPKGPARAIRAVTRLNGVGDKPQPVASTGGLGRLRDPRLA